MEAYSFLSVFFDITVLAAKGNARRNHVIVFDLEARKHSKDRKTGVDRMELNPNFCDVLMTNDNEKNTAIPN